MRETCKKACNQFLDSVESNMKELLAHIDIDALYCAAELIRQAEQRGGRIHISGIGKPAHIAGYVASLLSSTGTPTYFLHGTEAVHGSCGQLKEGDIVIFISNSGETAEMKSTVSAAINNGCDVIGVSGNSSQIDIPIGCLIP